MQTLHVYDLVRPTAHFPLLLALVTTACGSTTPNHPDTPIWVEWTDVGSRKDRGCEAHFSGVQRVTFAGRVELDQPDSEVRRHVEFQVLDAAHGFEFEALDLQLEDGKFETTFDLHASGYPRCDEAQTAAVAVYPVEVRVKAPGCMPIDLVVGPDWNDQTLTLRCF